MVKGLFVGIDPGITTGIAILDLYGNVVKIYSKRNMGRNEIIKTIADFGHPLIITSDVNPLPRNVKNIARKFNAKTFLQGKSLLSIEKKKIVRKYSDYTRKDHETDALAAVVKAWKNYRPFLSKIEKELKRQNLSEYFDMIVKNFLSGRYYNMEEAIDSLKTNKN